MENRIVHPMVLVVVKDAATVAAIGEAAAVHGLHTRTCDTTEQAGELLAGPAPWVALIVDPGLEGTKGRELLRKVRASRPALPILCIASDPDERVTSDAYRAGIRDLLVAPVSADELASALAALVPLHLRMDELAPIVRRLLVVDEDPEAAAMVGDAARRIGYLTTHAPTIAHAREAFHDGTDWSGVVIDPRMQHGRGLEFVRAVRRVQRRLPIVCFTLPGDHGVVHAAWQAHIQEMVFKPASPNELLVAMREILPLTLQGVRSDPACAGVWVAEPKMLSLLGRARAHAQRDWPVLITGETGAGKDAVARAIHYKSARRGGPLQVVNAAQLKGDLTSGALFGVEKGSATGVVAREGLIAQAQGGTLFIDEIEAMDPACQALFLLFLETGDYRKVGGTEVLHADVRIVAATNQDLSAHPGFRQDLFMRMARLTIDLPPLRERPLDVELLTQVALEECDVEMNLHVQGCAPEVMEALRRSPLRGNVRELKKSVRDGLENEPSGRLEASSLPAEVAGRSGDRRKKERRQPTQQEAEAAVIQCGGCYSAAAEQVGIHVASLYRKVPVGTVPVAETHGAGDEPADGSFDRHATTRECLAAGS